jgi:acetyl/propionyl-CoA carboxylase alpha subunit
MLGKLIAFGEDRALAIRRARTALDRYAVHGVPTNRALLTSILDHPTFQAGGATTEFLARLRSAPRPELLPSPEALAAAVAWELSAPADTAPEQGEAVLHDWRLAGQGVVTFWLIGPTQAAVAVHADRDDRHTWRITSGAHQLLVTVADAGAGLVTVRRLQAHGASSADVTHCRISRTADALLAQVGDQQFRVRRAPPPSADEAGTDRSSGGTALLEAPLPGRVVKIAVGVGDKVAAHQSLVVVEAMKIETSVAAPRDGVVAAIRCTVGEAVAGGQVLVELAP